MSGNFFFRKLALHYNTIRYIYKSFRTSFKPTNLYDFCLVKRTKILSELSEAHPQVKIS